jgi:hypothetical protein
MRPIEDINVKNNLPNSNITFLDSLLDSFGALYAIYDWELLIKSG